MRILAVVVLLATVVGAGAVLYGLNTLSPQVVQTSVAATPATAVEDTFDSLVSQMENNTFGGKVCGEAGDLRAEDCTFLTYTVRLQNKGFFPAEWISLELTDAAENDVLILPDDSRHALAAGSMGDIQLTLLNRTSQPDTARTLRVTCYVFGQKIAFEVSVS